MSEEGVAAELDRNIGIVGAVALGVGTMIAAGIFVLSGLAVSNVGAMAIVAFLIAAVVASFTAFAYAEFAAVYPESGGGYAYVANTFDTDLTYVVGWSMILGYPASAAFYLASFSDWFYRFVLPLFDLRAVVPYWVGGLAVLVLLVGLNLKGTEESGAFQIVVTALKVALIGLFLLGGLQAFDAPTVTESFADNLTKFRQIGLTSALVFITFFGFEAIATNAEEIEEPGRNVPRAIFFSMGFVTVVYALVVVVVVLAKEDPAFLQFLAANVDLGGSSAEAFIAENGEVSMAYAARYFLDVAGNLGFYVIIVGALFSMLSAANATVLAGSRVKLAMSRRDHLPPRFGRLHDRFNTPYYAVLLTGGLIFLFVLVFTVLFGGGPGSEATVALPVAIPVIGASLHLGIDAIAHFADFMLLTGLIVVNVAVVRSRRKFPDLDRSFEVPAVPWVPAVAVLANLALLVNVEPSSVLLGLAAEAIGVLVYVGVVARAPSTERIEEETPTVVAERHPTEREYTLVVPIANPDNARQLMRTARDVAAANHGEIVVLSVVTVPNQTPLSQASRYVDSRRAVLDRAMESPTADGSGEDAGTDAGTDIDADEGDAGAAGPASVPVSGTIRLAHDAADAIEHTVVQYDADAVLMGWRGRPHRRRDVVLGTVVDEVVAEADCDVLVERIGSDGPPESILVPTAGGPHAELAAETAAAIATTTGARIEVIHVLGDSEGSKIPLAAGLPRESGDGDRTQAEDLLERTLELVPDHVAVESHVVEADDPAEAIVERSGAHDVTVIGATRESPLERLLFGSVPETVGRRAEGTVIMTKRNLGVTSRLRQALDALH